MKTAYWFFPLLGGTMLGLASLGVYVFFGRIAGISGIIRTAIWRSESDIGWRVFFLSGLIAGGGILAFLFPSVYPTNFGFTWPMYIVSGFLVGFGTQLGNGCTSGHGICGISFLSLRSILATLVFMFTGAITVFVVRMVGAG